MKVVARIDANTREVIVRMNGEDKRFGTVMLANAEFGSGMIRGDLVETFAVRIPPKNLTKRAYFNRNKVSRYVDKESKKILLSSPGVYMYGSSVMYV